MIGQLVMRGMLVGLFAALLCFGFLKIVGEPSVDRAIAFESAMDEAKAKAKADEAAAKHQPAPVEEGEPELVSRPTQAGIGLLTALLVYCTAFGGLFALGFAFAYQRMSDHLSPRATAVTLACLGFLSLYLVPLLKYPANPPAVGLGDTIGSRTALYLSMLVCSLLVAILAGMARNRLKQSLGEWNATILAIAGYLVVILGVALVLPDVNEVPEGFPAQLLWQFRIASIGGQAILWATLGVVFGIAAQGPIAGRSSTSVRPATA